MSRRKVKDKIKGLNKLGNGVFGLGVLGSVVGRKVEGDLKEGRRNIEALMKQQVLLNSLNAVLMFDDVGQLNEFLLENHEQMVDYLKSPETTFEEQVQLYENIGKLPTQERVRNNGKISPEAQKTETIMLYTAHKTGTMEAKATADVLNILNEHLKQNKPYKKDGKVIYTLEELGQLRDKKTGKITLSSMEEGYKAQFANNIKDGKDLTGLVNNFSIVSHDNLKFSLAAINQDKKLSNEKKNEIKVDLYKSISSTNIKIINSLIESANNSPTKFRIVETKDENGKVSNKEIAITTLGTINDAIFAGFSPMLEQMELNKYSEESKLIAQGFLASIAELKNSDTKEGLDLFNHIQEQFTNFGHYYLKSKELFGKEGEDFNLYKAMETSSVNMEQKQFERNCTQMKHLIALPYIQEAVKALSKEDFIFLFKKMDIDERLVELVYEQAKNIPEKTLAWLAKQAKDQQTWIAINGSARHHEYAEPFNKQTLLNKQNAGKIAESVGETLGKSGVQNSKDSKEEMNNLDTNVAQQKYDIFSSISNKQEQEQGKVADFYKLSAEGKEKEVHKEIEITNANIEKEMVDKQLYEQQNNMSNNTDVYIANKPV